MMQPSACCRSRKSGSDGLFGGSYGAPGKNLLKGDRVENELPSKIVSDVLSGDVVSVMTPGSVGNGEGLNSKEPAHDYYKGTRWRSAFSCILFVKKCRLLMLESSSSMAIKLEFDAISVFDMNPIVN